MDFFNKAKESISAAGSAMAQKANDVSGVAKFTKKMHDEEKQLNDTYIKMGKRMYEEFNEDALKLLPEETAAVTNLLKTLEQDRKDLAVCKGMKICPNCGHENVGTATHCNACGSNMAEIERILAEKAMEGMTFCTNCGKPVAEGAAFCTNCGTKVE